MELTLNKHIKEMIWEWSPDNLTLEEADERIEKIVEVVTKPAKGDD